MNDKKKLSFSSKTINAGSNAKTIKGDEEYLTAIMYMAPYTLAGVGNMCSMAKLADCWKPCLNISGRGKFSNVQEARKKKTIAFTKDRQKFMDQLYYDILSFEKYCKKHSVKPAIRLNGTSDIRWELILDENHDNVFSAFPNVTYYDYTKIPNRKVKDIPNYTLTWSYSGANEKYKAYVKDAKKSGMNIAVVFRDEHFPRKFLNWNVIDGDKDDLRFLDPKNSIVGLKAKGPAKKDTSGFVVDI